MRLGRAHLEALRAKYVEIRVLAEAREAMRAAGGDAFPGEERARRKHAMKRLAARFPGALRELDAYDAARVGTRLRILDEALAREDVSTRLDEPDAAWVVPMCLFHALMRELLWLRRKMLAGSPPSPPESGPLPSMLSMADLGDPALLGRVRTPPGGRLSALALELLSERLGTPAAVLRALLSARHN